MKILVTGGAGFIGSNFIRFLLQRRPALEVVDLDALTYAGNLANFADLPPKAASRHHFVHGDIRDQELLEKLFADHDFDAVVHMAAESHVDRSIRAPAPFVETNVLGTFRLLEAACRHWERRGCPPGFRFLHLSTDEVFGSIAAGQYFTEKSPYNPSSPYSASKAGADHLVRAYHRTYGFPVVVVNCSNNYGPYQFPEKLIPLMILNAAAGKTLPVYGDGGQVRDWLYVGDHCEALLMILERGQVGETYVVGGEAEYTNLEVVELVCALVDRRLGKAKGSSRRLIRLVADRPGHDRRYAMDISKIKAELLWQPRVDFEAGLELTVGWYLQNGAWVEQVRTGEYRRWLEVHYGKETV